MRIRERIVGLIDTNEARVEEAVVGLGYTAVRLEYGRTGVSYTFRNMGTRGMDLFTGQRPLAGKPAHELLLNLHSDDPIECAVGMATANAFLSYDQNRDLVDGDVLQVLELLPSDVVGMVGNFFPMVPGMKELVKKLYIFERGEIKAEGLLPAQESRLLLPECTVAILSGTTLLNNTLEPLLEAAHACREVVLLGATTPLCPEAFVDSPITLLSGVQVTDPAEMMQIVREAGGTRAFRHVTRKLNMRVGKA